MILVLYWTLGSMASLFGLIWVGFKEDWVGLWLLNIHVRIPQKESIQISLLSRLQPFSSIGYTNFKDKAGKNVKCCNFCEVTFSDFLA